MPERCLNHNRGVAVLASGGIDSAILCVDLLEEFNRVHPLYVRFGLRWEDFEVTGLKRFLDAVARPGLMPLHVLEEPVAEGAGQRHILFENGNSGPQMARKLNALFVTHRLRYRLPLPPQRVRRSATTRRTG